MTAVSSGAPRSAPKSSPAQGPDKSAPSANKRAPAKATRPAAAQQPAPVDKAPVSKKTQAASRARAAGVEAQARARVQQQQQVRGTGPDGFARAKVTKDSVSVKAKGHLAKLKGPGGDVKVGAGEVDAKISKKTGLDAKVDVSAVRANLKTPDGGKARVDVGKAEGRVKVGPGGVSIKGALKSGEVNYTNKKGDINVRITGPSVEGKFEANPGKLTKSTKPGEPTTTQRGKGKLFGAKVGGSLAEAELTEGKSDPKRSDDTKTHLGVRAGLKVGGEVDVTDKDGDGRNEYTAKIDLGPVSFGVTQEGKDLEDAAKNLGRKVVNGYLRNFGLSL